MLFNTKSKIEHLWSHEAKNESCVAEDSQTAMRFNAILTSLKQNENNLFCDRKPFVAHGFCGVKNSPVIGYKTINIPDIF